MSYAETNAAGQTVEPVGVFFIITVQIICINVMMVPQRKIIGSHIFYMRNNGFVPGNTGIVITHGFFVPVGNTAFTGCSNPVWSITQGFNLLVFNKNGVCTNQL
jgi:hypothetical protein